jgi:putative lipoprotein (rSAM/lipoprotein system)
MKRILTNLLKSYNAVLAIMIAFLGFSVSCEMKAEYGVPNAKFIVNGKVESSLDSSPIKHIRVIMQFDSTLTDDDGNYTIANNYVFPGSHTFDIRFHDVDSMDNGIYENKDTIVTFTNPKFTKGNGHWYEGETSKEFNVKLKSLK